MSLLWPVASPVLWFKEICRASNAVTVELDGGVRKEKSLVLLQYTTGWCRKSSNPVAIKFTNPPYNTLTMFTCLLYILLFNFGFFFNILPIKYSDCDSRGYSKHAQKYLTCFNPSLGALTQ